MWHSQGGACPSVCPFAEGDKDFYCRVEKNGPEPGASGWTARACRPGHFSFLHKAPEKPWEGFGSGETYFIYIIATQYNIDRFKLVELKQKLNKMGSKAIWNDLGVLKVF